MEPLYLNTANLSSKFGQFYWSDNWCLNCFRFLCMIQNVVWLKKKYIISDLHNPKCWARAWSAASFARILSTCVRAGMKVLTETSRQQKLNFFINLREDIKQRNVKESQMLPSKVYQSMFNFQMVRFERHMKQEHEMYSNHGELLLSIHFLTGESMN